MEKNIRIRSTSDKLISDAKLNLSKSKSGYEVLIYSIDLKSILLKLDYSSKRYDNFSEYDIISDSINVLNKTKNTLYKIIQDPWSDISPIWRNYGFDPYYLNNGTKLIIDWINSDNTSEFGEEWSDDSGNELDIKRGMTQSSKGYITKKVSIIPPDDKNMYLSVSGIDYDINESIKFSGLTNDLLIIDQVLSNWKINVPNYNIDVCSPNNTNEKIIEYKSPLAKEDEIDEEDDENIEVDKIKMNVVLPEDINIKTKQDFDLTIYIGDILNTNEFIFQDYDNYDELDDIYKESDYSGYEEEFITYELINVESLNDVKGFDPENPDSSLSTNDSSVYPIPKNKQANISAIVECMKRKKITNKFTQAAILSIVSKECGFIPQNEASYSKSDPDRIKGIFKAMRKYSNSDVNRIKKIPREFFDIIYGGKFGNSSKDGFKYRGRGFNQLTFKGNYLDMEKKTGHKIVNDPDLLNTIDVASDCLIEYFKARVRTMSSELKKIYRTSDGLNDFKTLDDAVGAIYHANAGFAKSYSEIIKDSTGGRKKAFKAAPSLYANLK